MVGSRRSDRIPALVLGSGNLALGAVRVFGRKGVPVWVASATSGIETSSRWYRRVPGPWQGEHLAADLSRCGIDRAVLIPTSEQDAIAAAELPQHLLARFPSSTPPAGLLRSFADKERQAQMLRSHGVPLPRTWPAHAPSDVDRLSDEEVEHAFLKPRDSGRFSGIFGVKALRPRGREPLRHAIAEANSLGFEMILQEYVPGSADNSYLLDGFIDRHGDVAGLFARRRIRQYPHDFGNSSASRSIPREEVADIESMLLDFLRAVGYRGIFNAEFKRDPRDGAFYLLEINPRTWLYAEFAARCGFDALGMAYDDALGHTVTPCRAYEEQRIVIYPYYDLHALLRLRREGRLRLREGVAAWWGYDQLLYAGDDPRPAIVAGWKLLRGQTRRRVTRFRRRSPSLLA
jgi:predicted ATP-grasp superfamily ATP-dependent carboligase